MSGIPEDELDAMLAEDSRRRRDRSKGAVHDPLRGAPCPERVRRRTPEADVPVAYVPRSMAADPTFRAAAADAGAWRRLRCRHDFEYWCARCVVIKDKITSAYVPFRLNRAQRAVLAVLESDRLADRPIRLILLKARQWGGSTLVQIYMAWIQSCHRRNWHSLICAHVKDTAAGIRGMYRTLLANYPPELWEGDAPPQFKVYEGSANVREITGRGCRVTLGTAENADAVRGADYAMAHLSETAFWGASERRSPAAFVQAVCGAIALVPYSLIVMESTANGVGNYFHAEWLRCREGRGDKHAVFIPWYMIDIYSTPPPCRRDFAAFLDDYERRLWNMGIDLDRIYWYHLKSLEYPSPEQLHAEYPTDDVEAFANTGSGVFANAAVEALRAGCGSVAAVCGDVGAAGFVEDGLGAMKVWLFPEADADYIVAVDVGGRSAKADWSVVAVLRRGDGDRLPEIAAQWRGHCDHDLLARKAMEIGRYYNEALLVVESNTFETSAYGGGAAEGNLFVLARMADRYPNMYRRESYDAATQTVSRRVGFHTNRSTKAMLIAGMVEAVREGAYIEHDTGCCDEMVTYEQLPNGSYAAKRGYHDDMLMTRAIALHVAASPRYPSPHPDVSCVDYLF